MTAAKQREQTALAEQPLLVDRFKLTARFETKELPVFSLAVAKDRSKLTPAMAGGPSRLAAIPAGQVNELTAKAATL